jgi:hypothetical protein
MAIGSPSPGTASLQSSVVPRRCGTFGGMDHALPARAQVGAINFNQVENNPPTAP